MKIECILKRQGGTKAEIGGIEYHFAPQPDGAHVADVADNAHIQRFLSMPEGYRIYEAAGKTEPVKAPEQTNPNDQAPEGDRNGDGVVDGKDERIALAEAYKQKFGKAPHHKMTAESIRQKLAE